MTKKSAAWFAFAVPPTLNEKEEKYTMTIIIYHHVLVTVGSLSNTATLMSYIT
jgi:hypothetical protein